MLQIEHCLDCGYYYWFWYYYYTEKTSKKEHPPPPENDGSIEKQSKEGKFTIYQ